MLTSAPPGFSSTPIAWEPGWSIYPADFDANGRADLLFYSPHDGHWMRAVNDGAGGFSSVSSGPGGSGQPPHWGAGLVPTVVDLNGDGRSDLFTYHKETGAWAWCEVVAGQADFNCAATSQWSAGWEVFAARLNSDDREDLLLYNRFTGTWFRNLNTATGSFAGYSGTWAAGWVPTVADLDGDGLSDVVLYNPDTGALQRALSTADGTGWIYPAAEVAWASLVVRTGDFNADAIGDLLLYNTNPADPNGNGGRWILCLSTGSGSYTYSSAYWGLGWDVLVADLNADALSDVVLYAPASTRPPRATASCSRTRSAPPVRAPSPA